MIAWPSSRSLVINSSTLAVSWTPRAAVGSSMMIDLGGETRCATDRYGLALTTASRRTREPTAGTLTASADTISSALASHRAAVEQPRTGRSRRTISRLRNRFCHTVRSSTRARFWCTVSIPASRASCGERKCTSCAVEFDGAGVGCVHTADAADQGRLAGAVVADDGGDLAAARVHGHVSKCPDLTERQAWHRRP